MSVNATVRGPSPLFMFGFERSGTTLLSMMIGAHPEIAVPLTVTGLWYRYAGRLADYDQLTSVEALERLVQDLLDEERIRLWDVDLHRDDLLHDLPTGSYAAVVERFHRAYARRKSKPRWGNLDIATLDHMDLANRWFPSARFLHIVRDGRDVALSHETMPYGASNTLEAAGNWSRRITTSLKMGAMIGPERYKIVRYEDLITNSEETLGSICRFFDVVYSPAMLDYSAMVDEKVPESRRWLWPALDKPPDRTKVESWKKRMSRTKRIVFEGAAGFMLKELGYEAWDRVPKTLPAYVYELWCFLGRGGRFRRLASALGLRRASQLERSWQRTRKIADYRETQKEAFGALVREGTYSRDSRHAPSSIAFFEDCLRAIAARIDTGHALRVLDCGCGPGAWLEVFFEMDGSSKPVDCFGFDLTGEMVDTARERLAGRLTREHLQQGDVLADESYVFCGNDRPFQIIYAFDVVQQLPRGLQFDAVRAMSRHVSTGGCVVIFDHERWSRYGLRMGFRKFVTKYVGIRLVPSYYCNARYPALSRIASRLSSSGSYTTEIRVAPDGRKKALLIWRRGEHRLR